MRHMRPMGLIRQMSLMGLVALAGCSSSEEVVVPAEEQGTAIVFSADMTEQQSVTRSTTPLEEKATSFKVWAYKNNAYDDGTESYTSYQTVIDEYYVGWTANTAATTTTNTHNWEYILMEHPLQTIKYWDFGAKAYRFFAAAPASASGTFAMDGSGNSYTITLPADAAIEASDAATPAEKIAATPYYSRLWFSTGALPAYSDKQFGQPVVLEFIKPLARVRFMFIYVYPREGITLTNKCFKPTTDYDLDPSVHVGIPRKGSVTISFPLKGTKTKESMSSMAPDGSEPKALDEFTEDYDAEDYSKVYTETDGGWYIVLPNTTQGSYKLKVDVNKTTRYAEVPAEYMQWESGYQYTYIFKITEEGGVEFDLVSSAFTPWTELSMSHEIYNW